MDSKLRFPNLNIRFFAGERYFTIFGFPVSWYGLILCLALVLSFLIIKYFARQNKVSEEKLSLAMIAVVCAAFLSGRIIYAISVWDYYKVNFSDIFLLRIGSVDTIGAFIGGAVCARAVSRSLKFSTLQFFDWLTYGVLLCLILGNIGRIFCFDITGAETNSLFAMQVRTDMIAEPVLDDFLAAGGTLHTFASGSYVQVHPVFLYEAIYDILLAAGLFVYQKKTDNGNGEQFALCCICFSVQKLIVNGFFVNHAVRRGISSNTAVIVSVLGLLASIVFFGYLIKMKKTERERKRMFESTI